LVAETGVAVKNAHQLIEKRTLLAVNFKKLVRIRIPKAAKIRKNLANY